MINTNSLFDIISIIVKSMTIGMLVFLIVPLQIKESRVKNGMQSLRRQLLIVGMTMLITNVVAVIAISLHILHLLDETTINTVIEIVNAFSFFILAITFYIMYHIKFTIPKD